MDPTTVSFAAVISTGAVSVSSIFVPVVIDHIKARRATEEAKIDRTEQTARDLLSELSRFRHPVLDDIRDASGRGPLQLYSDLQSKGAFWELAIWPRLGEKDRERVKALRRHFEEVHTPDYFKGNLPEITGEVISLTLTAVHGK